MSITTERSDSELLESIREIFRDGLGVEPISPIEPETRFFADLGLASIDAVVLGEVIQAHFGRSLPYESLMADIGARSQRDMAISELITFLKTHL